VCRGALWVLAQDALGRSLPRAPLHQRLLQVLQPPGGHDGPLVAKGEERTVDSLSHIHTHTYTSTRMHTHEHTNTIDA